MVHGSNSTGQIEAPCARRFDSRRSAANGKTGIEQKTGLPEAGSDDGESNTNQGHCAGRAEGLA